MQIKTMRYYCTPIEMTKIQNTDNTKIRQGCGTTETHSLLVRMHTDTTTLEYRLAVSYQAKHILIIQSSGLSPWHVPKWVENLYPHKILHMNVDSSFVHIVKTWKQPKCPWVGEWINKLVHPYSGILFHSKNSASHEKAWKNVKCILLSAIIHLEDYILCDPTTDIWKWQNCVQTVARNLGVGRKRNE